MKIGVVGCAGRMGQMLMAEILSHPTGVLAGGTERSGSPSLGRDLGSLIGAEPVGVTVHDDPDALFRECAGVIDFTTPAATVFHARLAQKTGCALVIGTTGLDEDMQAQINEAALHIPIVQAPNMSIGVNVLFALTRQLSSILDENYDIEIVEMHHRRKVDAPSGTALGLGKAAAAGRGIDLSTRSDRVRDGHTGARTSGNIGFATLRGGDVVGDHTVIFAADGERVELTHKASDRRIFASGAVRAALWLDGKAPGRYDMADVLGLS